MSNGPFPCFSQLLSQSNVNEEFQAKTLLKSNPFVPTHVPQALRICIDDPFLITNAQYGSKSSSSLLDLTGGHCDSSLAHPQNVLAESQCRTPGLDSNDYLVRSRDPRIPTRHRRWIKTSDNSRNSAGHKLIEKQRRNNMKDLCSMLRSLLPDESLQGKRSLSDEIQEAINYIHHLEQKVKELGQKRDDMRISDNIKKRSFRTKDIAQTSASQKFLKIVPYHGTKGFPVVTIKNLGPGFHEITVNTLQHLFLFSDLLLAVEEEGLEVVTAVATATNDKVFLTIHSKSQL